MDELSITRHYSADSEYAVIGAICIDPTVIDRLVPILDEEDFVIAACRVCYTTAREYYYSGKVFDAAVAGDAISNTVENHVEFIRECMINCPSVENAEVHAKSVHSLGKKRRLMEAIRKSMEEDEDNIAANVAGICQDYLKDGTTSGHSSADMMQRLYRRMGEDTGNRIDTGYTELDKILKGIWPGNLVYIGARPGVGKSAFLMDLAIHAAKHGVKTAYYSMEMLEDELAERMAAAEGLIPMDKFIDRDIADGDWKILARACASLSSLPLTVYDKSNMSVDLIHSNSRANPGLGLIVVDYIGLMQSSKKYENRNLELGAISRALKNLATELKIPIVVATQLNRGVDETSRPTMKEIRDSGELEQDANKILFLWKEDPETNTMGVSVAKNRRGKTGQVSMKFQGEYMLFTEITDREEPYRYGER